MSEHAPSRRVLDPFDRVSEVWFGLIMVLTLTCSISVVHGGDFKVRRLLIEALGCNLAWGIIDAFMYLAGSLSERGRLSAGLHKLRTASTQREVTAAFRQALPPVLEQVLTTNEIVSITERLNELPDAPSRPRVTRDDLRGALAVFLLVFLSTFPVVIPFLFWREPLVALRISNLIAAVLLFMIGYRFGRSSGYHPIGTALATTVFVAALVAVTIRLGG